MARDSLHSFELEYVLEYVIEYVIEYDGVWFSAGSAPLTPVLFVCIFLVILAPVSFLPIIYCSCFHGAIFFYSVINVLKCSEVQYFTQNILSKSKITDLKKYLKKYKYTKSYSITVTRVNVIRYFPPLVFIHHKGSLR